MQVQTSLYLHDQNDILEFYLFIYFILYKIASLSVWCRTDFRITLSAIDGMFQDNGNSTPLKKDLLICNQKCKRKKL